MQRAFSFIAASVLWATASMASAQLYKWVDGNGVVNYGDWPPAGVKLQPVNRGTFSSVADSALTGSAASAPAPRSARRTGATGLNQRNDASTSKAPAPQSDASAVDTATAYNGYPLRPVVAAEAVADRRPGNVGSPRPLLPIDAVPEMPRPRR